MTLKTKNWWDDDTHPDAEAHREFLKEREYRDAPRIHAGVVTEQELADALENAGTLVGTEFNKLKARIEALEDREFAGTVAGGSRVSARQHRGVWWLGLDCYLPIPERSPWVTRKRMEVVCEARSIHRERWRTMSPSQEDLLDQIDVLLAEAGVSEDAANKVMQACYRLTEEHTQ